MDTEPDVEVPAWDDFLHPVLTVLAEQGRLTTDELSDSVSAYLNLTEAQSSLILPWKQDTEVAYAIVDATGLLERAGALEKIGDAHSLTAIGSKLLADHPDAVTIANVIGLSSYRKEAQAKRQAAKRGPGAHATRAVFATLFTGALAGLLTLVCVGGMYLLIKVFEGGIAAVTAAPLPVWVIAVPAGAALLAVAAVVTAIIVSVRRRERTENRFETAAETAAASLELAVTAFRALLL